MNKVMTSIENLKKDIGDFYKPELHHFMVMNAVEVGDQIEVQWFFSDYAHPCDTTCFYTLVSPETEIPSIKDIVASAWVAEAELVDLMNIKVENTQKGFVLEPDFESGPLRKKK
ncbi:MAG: NADH-quinone oxidoreductase subunit C [Chitinophagaceae bacterium]|nr:NADH-quinone oxidoreductase subunit C [Chitinophagaceae bacterium]HQV59669.1 NADH-quinone oxidoreductase subunit C [Chitinophagaceae bacterium]HQV86616.1 NADH-quinone oxidoreductase subunit C [Chitinophagaceae bacterium]HQZ73273.1 NADH-quinone oxidoreductase subunit C [Chitinophagaceae bacterium]